ncbi:MAG: T9SS type A sorting domain-containing protein [Bacteroidetes bacterium]|nr:T9SS type A sorting domain-containing protein [Bacteroidota bacterium]
MRKLITLLACTFFYLGASAAPGDTTWVQAHNGIWLDGYGSYDTAVTFPNGATSYRKIYMIFTLGKHQCPGNPQYCGDWDYTIQNYLMTPTGDTLELGRLISPYANASAPRTPWTWTQHYVYDVTDYYPVLKNAATIRIFYSGYSGGFTGNIKFAFVEGTPERDVKGVQRLWNGSFGFGGATAIDTYFPPISKTAPAGTQNATLKFTVTGHGSDNNQCSEFCSKYYDVLLNASQVDHKNIWRSDCGSNDLYPQSGTWLYERGNWCPGALVRPNFHDLPGVVGGNSYNVDINFEPYSGNGGASYTTEAHVFYYGSMNKNLDASLDDITAPTNYEGHFRANPNCGSPSVHVKNTGSTPISAIHFRYGMDNQSLSDFTWTGSLNSLQDAEIALPPFSDLENVADTLLHKFIAEIVDVNGNPDADVHNDTLTSYFKPAPQWPNKFIVNLSTNNEPDANNSNYSETSWQILDMNNNVIRQRVQNAISTTYADTVVVGAGCYKLVVNDAGCDGLHWWVGDQTGITAGSIRVRKITQVPVYITLDGNPSGGTYHDDFGCGFTQYFTTLGFPAGVTNLSAVPQQVEAFPNPAKNTVAVNISGIAEVSGTLQLLDALGRVVLQKECNNISENLEISQLPNGVYTLVFTDKNNASAKLQTRLLIAK